MLRVTDYPLIEEENVQELLGVSTNGGFVRTPNNFTSDAKLGFTGMPPAVTRNVTIGENLTSVNMESLLTAVVNQSGVYHLKIFGTVKNEKVNSVNTLEKYSYAISGLIKLFQKEIDGNLTELFGKIETIPRKPIINIEGIYHTNYNELINYSLNTVFILDSINTRPDKYLQLIKPFINFTKKSETYNKASITLTNPGFMISGPFNSDETIKIMDSNGDPT